MRILFIAMPNSIHTARWINQVCGMGWDLHLFPSIDSSVNLALRGLTVHDYFIRPPNVNINVDMRGAVTFPFNMRIRGVNFILNSIRNSSYLNIGKFISDRSKRLSRLISNLKPDIIHSLEIQHAGYTTLETKKRIGKEFPKWLVTNWGSDIYLFGRLPGHSEKIKEVLTHCDYYSCECKRDIRLGKEFGFKGVVLPVLPNTGGFDLSALERLRKPDKPSRRRTILLKGYQGWAGRALVGVQALIRCADLLQGYRVAVYLASPEVKIAAELATQATGVPFEIIPHIPHDEIMRLFGNARVYLGLSISDAIPTSLLEAMAMGTFPIQSKTSCADEWIDDGSTGILVPPEDPDEIAAALKRSLTDDDLVDEASKTNMRVISDRLEYKKVQRQVVAMYEQIVREHKP